MDIMVLVPLYPINLLQVGMEFELMGVGLDGRSCDEVLQLFWAEVGDANFTDFACDKERFHSVPCLESKVSRIVRVATGV